MPRFVEVAKRSQIPENSVIGVEVEGKILALVNLNGEIYALDDSCPHQAGPLSEGAIEGEEIVCPWHASHFDVKTGRVTMDPAVEDIAPTKCASSATSWRSNSDRSSPFCFNRGETQWLVDTGVRAGEPARLRSSTQGLRVRCEFYRCTRGFHYY